MRRKTKMVIIFLSFFFQTLGQAQVNSYFNSTPPSPNSAAFEKYGMVPVNLSSGVITPSVPLFTIPMGSNSFEVKIYYSSQGLRVDEMPTSLGMGWSLNLGSITRTIRDFPDEDNSARMYNINLPIMGSDNFHIGNTLNGDRVDSERDLFTLNVDGYQTKFMLDENLEVTKLTVDDLKIEIINPLRDSLVSSHKLRVITPNGTKYFFGGNGGVETSNSRPNQIGGFPSRVRHINAWFLSQVIYPDGRRFRIFYQRNRIWYTDGYSQTAEIGYRAISGTETGTPMVYPAESRNFNTIAYVATPLRIAGDDFEINFQIGEFENIIESEDFPKLQSVTVKSAVTVQNIAFAYDEYPSNNIGAHSHSVPISRPFLKSITFHDDSPENSSSYSFEYYNPDKLPNRFSFAQDILGYYNGKNNTKFIYNSLLDYNNLPEYPSVSPTETDFINLTHKVTGDRKPNKAFAKNGTLSKIIYPTKGYTEFTYEGNLTTNKEKIYPPYTEGVIEREATSSGGAVSVKRTISVPFDQKLYIHTAIYTKGDFTCGETIEGTSLLFSIRNLSNGSQVSFNHITDLGLTVQKDVLYFPLGDSDFFIEDAQERIYAYLEAGKQYEIEMFTKRCANSKVSFLYYSTPPVDGDYVEAGGLRIDTIKSFDHTDSLVSTKKYEYEDGDFTIVNSDNDVVKPISTFNQKINMIGLLDFNNNVVNAYSTVSYFLSSSPRWSLRNNFGEFYTYFKVIEKELSESGTEKGSIAHYFEKNQSKLPVSIQFIPTSFSNTSNYHYKTNEKKTEFYDSNGIIQKRITYQHKKDSVRFNTQYSSYTANRTLDLKCADIENIYDIRPCPLTFFGFHDTDPANWSIMKSYDQPEWEYLSKIETTDYVGGVPLSTVTEYFYNNPLHYQPTSQKTTFPNSSVLENHYQYAHEKGNQYLQEKNMIGIPLETETTKTANGATKTISKTETVYPTNDIEANLKSTGLPLPYSILQKDLKDGTMIPKVEYKYDISGNIIQYTLNPDENGDGTSVAIIWGYKRTQPIAKIEGATMPNQILAKITDIPQNLIDSIVSASDDDADYGTEASENALLAALDDFRTDAQLSGFQITTYTYDPLIGVRSITPPSGIREYYNYDAANRLKEVKDINGNMLKEYQYHYKP
ncbi:hypothetical protein [Chryseobacterium koreense]|nr:hypothetical protein [Chryseobacterium koreense]MBB5334830.1 hypothetical protein [Chryseobacterium koreense]